MTMANNLRETWDDIAYHWDAWGPPLRPCAEDLRITEQVLARWHAQHPIDVARVFMCGVTPEIATMRWPFPIDLVAMDHAESMVRMVWPGDVEGVRTARVGNWMDSGIPPGSQDIVIGDGGFGFFDYPSGQRRLIAALRSLLKPNGLFVYRHYAQIEARESLADVLTAAGAGQIGNFHVFKWRLAMALQPDSRAGVRVGDVWSAWTASGIDPSRLPQPGWSASAVDTIRFYRDKDGRLYFPTVDEFRELLAEAFSHVEMQSPSYELGERCPIFAAR